MTGAALGVATILALAWTLWPAPAEAAGKRARDVPLAHPKLEAKSGESAKDEPAAAEAFFLKQRLGPGMKSLPVERLLAAREKAQRMRLHSTAAGRYLDSPADLAQAQSLTWTALGPGNVGGRTRVFKFDPNNVNTIYAAGVAGGVWKSTNSGASWAPLGDFMANMAVVSLAIDPTNSLRIYAGTGEGTFNIDAVRGAGIFLSTDGGASWAQIPSTAGFTRVNDLLISPNDHNTLYAATRSGLWSSNDAGTTWTQRINAQSAAGCFKVVARTDVATNDTVVASCGSFSPTDAATGIWRSTNGNAVSPTWTHIVGPSGSGASQTLANMGRTSLAVAPSSQGTIYALIACSQAVAADCGSGAFAEGLLAVYRSTDGGASWSSRYTSTFNSNTHSPTLADLILTNPYAFACSNAVGFNQGWYDNAIAVNPTDPNQVFAGGIDWFRSSDGGATWGLISYWWVPPTGQSYSDRYAHADQHVLTFHPNFNGTSETRLFLGNDGGLFQSSNAISAATGAKACPKLVSDLGTVSWSNLNNSYGVTQYYHGTAYPGGAEYFGGSQDNGTTRGDDGSGPNAWVEINGGDGGWTGLDPSTSGSSRVLYAEFTGISIQKSSDDGATFADAITGISNTSCGQFINPFQMDPNNPQRLFTSHNVLWRTANAAGSWAQASAAIPGTSCTVPASDSGERFTNYAVAPGNSDLLVAGTDNGRLCRLTSATTSTSSTALQDCSQPAGSGVYISDVAFDPQNNANVYASFSTFGVGHVWKSVNSGVSWTNIDGVGLNALPDVPADSVVVSPFDSNTIYAGTDVGVFVTTDGGTNWARENTGFANVITDHLAFNSIGASSAYLFAFTHGRGAFRTSVVSVPKQASNTTLGATPEPSVFGQSVTLTATVSGLAGTPTGSVQFKDGANVLGSSALSSGQATLNVSSLSVASHSLSANYSGDATYQSSIGNDTHVVNAANTTLVISTTSPTVFGQAVAVNATLSVTAPGAGTPTGTISVTGTGGAACTITLPATSCNLNFASTGAKTINASYGGSTSFNGSTASSIGHSVNPANTTLAISTTSPTVFGQAVAVNATLSVTAPGAGTPTGSISVTGTGGAACTITLPATSCNLSFTSTGAKTINASYGGDASFNGSSASSIGHTVNPANTSLVISTTSPTVFGQAVAVNATLSVTAPGAGTPTGSISVTGTGGAACTITLPATSCNLSFSSAGAKTVNASYSGDASFNGSTASSIGHTVNKASTTLSIDDPVDPTVVGESVAVNATLAVTAPGSGTPGGSITVTGSNTAGCTITLPATSCNATFSAAGPQTLSASYGGDTNFNGSTASTISHTVNKAATTLAIDDPTDPTVFGQSVTVNATLAVTAPGSGTPGGSITVTGSNTTGCVITLPATSCSASFTAVGAQTLSASYGGDTNFNASSASTINHTVNKAATTLAISDPVDPTVFGQQVAVNATLSAAAPGAGTPTGSITVTGTNTAGCTITLPSTSCNLAFTAAGAQTLGASYGGDTHFNSSNAAGIGHTVNPAATTLAIDDNPDPSDIGQLVTIGATLAVVAPGAGIPGGQITVTGTSTTGCNIVLPAVSCQLSFSAAGAKTINASYGGDANFAGSIAAPISHTVNSGVDLAVSKNDHVTNAVLGTTVSYDIVVSNPGTEGVGAATLADAPPAGLSGVSWTCTPTPPATCAQPSGTGTINELVTLAPGESLTYTLTGTVGGLAGDSLSNTATITAPTGVTDINPANDSATDTDQVVANKVFDDSFESAL